MSYKKAKWVWDFFAIWEKRQRLKKYFYRHTAPLRLRSLIKVGKDTYLIQKNQQCTTITCLGCLMESFNINDVQEKYCVSCDYFH